MPKIAKSIKFDETTIAVINSLLLNPDNLKLKNKFNPMVEYLVETHPDFIKQKNKLKIKK